MEIALAIASLLAVAGWFAFCVKMVKSKWERDELADRIGNLKWARRYDKEEGDAKNKD